jgi:hypothetical protein
MPGFGFEPRRPDQPLIFTSAAGYETYKMSYSLGEMMSACGQKVDYAKLQGIRQITESAQQHLGKVVESVLGAYYKMGGDPVEMFTKQWEKCKNWTTIEYPDKSSIDDWEGFLGSGQKWFSQLVERGEEFEFLRSGVFSEELLKDPWYNGSPLSYIADWHDKEAGFMLDIKVTAKAYPQEPAGLASMDPQLLTGALVSGITHVGFLNFVRVVKDPRIQIVEANIKPSRLKDVDTFLREQYDRLRQGRFYRSTGTRWPNDRCVNCEFLPLCLDNPAEAAKTLTTKPAKSAEEMKGLD